MSVEAADLTTLLSRSPNHSRPTGLHELKQLHPFFLPLSTANAHAASRHAWKSHDKTGPSLPERMSGGWNHISPPQSGGERHSDHKHKVMKRHYDSVRERERQRYGIKGWVCPRDLDCGPSVCDKQKGIFTLTDERRVASVRAAVTVCRLQDCMSYCMENTGAFRGHGLPELFFFFHSGSNQEMFLDEWSGLTHLSLSLKK